MALLRPSRRRVGRLLSREERSYRCGDVRAEFDPKRCVQAEGVDVQVFHGVGPSQPSRPRVMRGDREGRREAFTGRLRVGY
jgi:hypothetical protein